MCSLSRLCKLKIFIWLTRWSNSLGPSTPLLAAETMLYFYPPSSCSLTVLTDMAPIDDAELDESTTRLWDFHPRLRYAQSEANSVIMDTH